MGLLLKALREVAFAIGVFLLAFMVGHVLYQFIGDVGRVSSMDRSSDAAMGAGFLFALIVLVVHIVRRVLRRGKKPQRDKP